MRILLFIAFSLIGYGISYGNTADSLVKYDLLEKVNGGGYVLTREDVSSVEIAGKPYKKKVFRGNQLASIAYYNESGSRANLLDSISIIEFEYKKDLLRMIRLFNKEELPAEYSLFGYASIQLFYDDKKRVIKEVFRDKNSQIMKYNVEADSQPSYITFKYENGKVLAREYDENDNPISKEAEVDVPCIPFLDCK